MPHSGYETTSHGRSRSTTAFGPGFYGSMWAGSATAVRWERTVWLRRVRGGAGPDATNGGNTDNTRNGLRSERRP